MLVPPSTNRFLSPPAACLRDQTLEPCRSEITCCDPEQNLGYPGKYGQYPESLTSLELATPAGTCTFTFTYFDTPDLSKDGLCVGSVEAVW